MKRILLTFIFMLNYGITSQVLAKEEGKIQEDEFGTKPTIIYLAKDVTFLDEMKMKLLLTPEQMEKMKMIIQAEKEDLERLQQKWIQILKDEKLSVAQKREERANMDKEVIQIAKKTKTDVEETLTTFQYNEFITWIKHRERQEKISPPTPQKSVNPFEEALHKNKEIREVPPPFPTTLTKEQQEAVDEFKKALELQSEQAQNLFPDSLQSSEAQEGENPFAKSPDEELEDLFLLEEENDSQTLTNPFEEALRKYNEKKE